MVEINLKGVGTFKMPTSWSEISIKQFQEIDKLEIDSDISRSVAYLSVLSGISINTILDMPFNVFKELEQYTYFINEKPKDKICPIITIDGVEYGYRMKISEMSTAEFCDFDTIYTAEKVIENIHLLIAILYRKITKKRSETDFDIEKYNFDTLHERAEMFKNSIKMDNLLSALSFFQAHVLIYSGVMLDFSEQSNQLRTLSKKKKKIRLNLAKNGGGLFRFIKSVVAICKKGKNG